MMRVSLLLGLALLGLTAGVSYEGYKTYNVMPKSEDDNKLLSVLQKNKNVDFWSPLNTVGKNVTIMVAPSMQAKFVRYLTINQISYGVEIENVESTIQEAKTRRELQPRVEKGKIAFDQYLTLEEINDYLAQLVVDHPDIVMIHNIGQSYEKRDMNVIHISTGGSDKPVIFIDAGVHAREWIAPAVALYIISQLVEEETNRYLIEDVDWVILPSVNPDGYEFTWAQDRFWRKTRTPGEECIGVDANRNYDYHWGESGASDYECDSTYAGPSAFSEIENVNLINRILSTNNVKLYLNLHSYGQYLLYPWSYTTENAENSEELQELGTAVNNAISAVRGTIYTVGSVANALYLAAGDSVDWVLGVAGISLSYTIELPGGGSQGFDLPPEEILPVCTETWEGIKAFYLYVAPTKPQ